MMQKPIGWPSHLGITASSLNRLLLTQRVVVAPRRSQPESGLYLIDLIKADDSHGSIFHEGQAPEDDLEDTALAIGMDSLSLLRSGQILR